MPHVNQMTVGPFHWRRDNKTAEEIVAENPVGKVMSDNRTPYVYKIVESRAVPQGDGIFEISWLVEPASPEEAEAYHGWAYDSKDPEDQASQARWYLWQKSWHSGIPAGTMIFCEGHQKMMPAHGGNHYDNALVCNECVGKIEKAIARKEIYDPQEWIRVAAEASKIHNFIDKAEQMGEGCFQLGMRRYIEITVLYQFIANNKYKGDAIVEDWYPYKDMIPDMYKGWLREDWMPGEYFNAPSATIVFTDRNKLLAFLETGELPKQRKAGE